MQIIESAIIFVGTVIAGFFGCKISKPKEYVDNYLSLENTLPLRGLLAIVIVLHHLVRYFDTVTFMDAFKHIGYLVVAIFFFLSGYGLYYGFANKNNYLKGFLIKRIPSILIPFWIANIIYAISLIISGTEITMTRFLKSSIGIDLFIPPAWYIFMLLGMYLVFYFSFIWKNEKARIIIFVILFLVVQVGLILLKVDKEYTRSLAAFPFGVFWCKYKKNIDSFIKKHWIISFFSSGFLFGVTLAMRYIGEHFDIEIIRILSNSCSSIMVCAFVFVCLNKITLNNAVLRFLGKISIDIYLYHTLVYFLILEKIFHVNQTDMLLFVVLTLVITIAISFGINFVESKIVKGINKCTGKLLRTK